MGVSTVTAARILKGQLHHSTGEETRLEMDKFPFVALSKVGSSSQPSTPTPPTSQPDRRQERAGAGSAGPLKLPQALARWLALLGSPRPHCAMTRAAATSQGFIGRVLAHRYLKIC